MDHSQKLKRIKIFQAILKNRQIDAAIINLSRDLFYYSGTAQPCILLVTSDDYRLLVRRGLDFAEQQSFLDRKKIKDKGSLVDARNTLCTMGISQGILGLELDIIPAALYLKIKNIFNHYKLIDISENILEQRMYKDDHEIANISQACRIMDAGHKRVLKTLHSGMTELRLAAEVEYAHRCAGHEGILSMRNFDFYISTGPLASGKNLFKVSGFANTVTGTGLSPAVPAGPSNTIIKTNDLIIIDIPTCYRGYHCDQTRTYFLGHPSREIKELFKKLKEIFNQTLLSLKQGITCKEVFETACNSADNLGVSEYFLGTAPRKANFAGHGIGLDANEPPIIFNNSDFKLQKNFVIAIELHLTHPEHGAVKLEDLVLIKKNTCQILTLTPRKLFTLA